MALFCFYLYVAKKRKLRIIEKFVVVNNFSFGKRETIHFVKMLSINFWHSLRLHPICSSMLLPFLEFPSPPQRLEKIPPINIKH